MIILSLVTSADEKCIAWTLNAPLTGELTTVFLRYTLTA